ncbi:MAG: hypothetical protein AVDCRST_MAG78-132 [uncultured Rubrobacteraceae bacterium]|uniref:Uncharacterized protein n=1 Tax=uncultured Rubrobacteraceae bacterium TaxID=349277 RepID=A0A6J4P7B9_9ACTN|nr:MAG: hypothetical protein AVDCRST_MAG78-132 [uncultured Rubrobacteraceae bacterium]
MPTEQDEDHDGRRVARRIGRTRESILEASLRRARTTGPGASDSVLEYI